MALKVAINGMGVIGRELFRTLWDDDRFAIVVINDITISPKNLAYLLKYDSIYHNFGWEKYKDSISAEEDGIIIAEKAIHLYNESDVNNLPVGPLGVDVVLECTGNFTSYDKLQAFINAGAKRVIACYSVDRSLHTVAFGANESMLEQDDCIISFAEAETQVLANVLKPLDTDFGIETAVCKAFRSYANSQPTMDSVNTKDFARGRAAAWNITPLSDSAGKSIGWVVPELNGKVVGFEYRAPVINGGIMDISMLLKGNVTKKQINESLKYNSSKNLGYSEDQLCSSDALGFEMPMAMANSTVTMYGWGNYTLANISVAYDNVRGYCLQIKRFLEWAMEPDSHWLW